MKLGNMYGLKNILSIIINFSSFSNHMSEQLNVPKKEKHNNERNIIRPIHDSNKNGIVALSVAFKLKI